MTTPTESPLDVPEEWERAVAERDAEIARLREIIAQVAREALAGTKPATQQP